MKMSVYTICIVAALVTVAAATITSSSGITISNEYEPVSKNASKHVLRDDDPPYGGTIFVEPNIINSNDPTSYLSKTYIGTGMRLMYDRREGWVNVKAYLFEVTFEKGVKAVFQVHKEFGNQSKAAKPVETYAPDVGKIPMEMLENVSQVWIMKGNNPWGGGINNDGTGHILIHTEKGDEYANDGIVEETLIHEAAHASLDKTLYNDAWFKAADKDKNYISDYAKDYPNREDVAETFLMYFAVEYQKNRLSATDRALTVNAIPNRIKYLNSLNLDMYPFNKGDTKEPTNADTPVPSAVPSAVPTGSPGNEDKCDGLEKKPCKKVKVNGTKVCIYRRKKKIGGDCDAKNKFADSCEYTTSNMCDNGSNKCKWENNSCKHVCIDLKKDACKKKKIDGKKVCKVLKISNPCYGCNPKSECKK